MRIWSLAALTLAAVLSAQLARAQVPMDGAFLATEACPAEQSIRTHANPGKIRLVPNQVYDLIGANRPDPSHYWLVVPGAQPDRRWVEITCGMVDGHPATTATSPAPSAFETRYILAASWQPAFCETRPNTTECRNQTADRFDASHFALHGLWPQRLEYCGINQADRDRDTSGDWDRLPAVTLPSAIARELDTVMPGRQSALERHEWTKHGSCYGADFAEYFGDALAMMSALNDSAVRRLFADNLGKRLTRSQIRAAFDQSFGVGAGDRVRISCDDDGSRRIIVELTIGLTGDIASPADFDNLTLAARPTDGGCDAGIVDAVGLQ